MSRPKRPFWLPASNYYVLAVAVSAATFFILWGLLHDALVEMPWVTSGVGASIVLGSAVIIREVVLRRARNRLIAKQWAFDRSISHFPIRDRVGSQPGRLTLAENALILGHIQQKSDAAQILNKLSAGHREVFELCAEYIVRNEMELRNISASSPRLSTLIRSRTSVAELHKFHLLRWAEIETRTLAGEAASRSTPQERVEAANSAFNIVESALSVYPDEPRLLESREVIRELAVSIRVSQWVEEAERAEFSGDIAKAKQLFREALFFLARDNVITDDRERVAEHLSREIDRLSLIGGND